MEEWLKIVLYIVGALLALGVVFAIFCLFFISWRIYLGVLVRKNKEKWGRTCSAPDDPGMVEMWDIGLAWGKKNFESMKVVSIQNDGLKLVGEFFDFGYTRTAFIVQGRSECCKYSYFYAEPYQKAGYNILVIDTRAHGMSEGKYNTAGVKESQDVLAWCRFLHDELNQTSIVIHSICVGGSATTIAVTDPNCPEYIDKVIFDGLFATFVDSFARHMKEQGHGKSPIYYMIWFWFRIFGKCSVRKSAPIKYIDKLNKPVLFLYGKEDIFSIPKKSQLLFEKCGSEHKVIHWFEHGAHSRIRLVNPEEYDTAIINFVK